VSARDEVRPEYTAVTDECADCGAPFGYDVPAGTVCSSCGGSPETFWAGVQ